MSKNKTNEIDLIHKRYANRSKSTDSDLYSMLRSSFFMEIQERERALINLLAPYSPLKEKKIIEIGCGDGAKILQLIQLGFTPENIVANELLPSAISKAQHRLPESVTILEGDASKLSYEKLTFDFVYQSTVFSSILDNNFRENLATMMWDWIKPGGAIIWYDFIVNNPKNKDVRGVPYKRIQALFPDAIIKSKRVTLAPPINRRVTKVHPSLYTLCNAFPFLRTHVLCFIKKPNL